MKRLLILLAALVGLPAQAAEWQDSPAVADLPLAKAAQSAVREITRLEQVGNRQLHGKTGWQNAPGPGIGWWVGWVEEGGRIYGFALNIDIHTPAEAKQRVELGRAGLRVLGVW